MTNREGTLSKHGTVRDYDMNSNMHVTGNVVKSLMHVTCIAVAIVTVVAIGYRHCIIRFYKILMCLHNICHENILQGNSRTKQSNNFNSFGRKNSILRNLLLLLQKATNFLLLKISDLP